MSTPSALGAVSFTYSLGAVNKVASMDGISALQCCATVYSNNFVYLTVRTAVQCCSLDGRHDTPIVCDVFVEAVCPHAREGQFKDVLSSEFAAQNTRFAGPRAVSTRHGKSNMRYAKSNIYYACNVCLACHGQVASHLLHLRTRGPQTRQLFVCNLNKMEIADDAVGW